MLTLQRVLAQLAGYSTDPDPHEPPARPRRRGPSFEIGPMDELFDATEANWRGAAEPYSEIGSAYFPAPLDGGYGDQYIQRWRDADYLNDPTRFILRLLNQQNMWFGPRPQPLVGVPLPAPFVPGSGRFPPDVRLDPSQVQDRRARNPTGYQGWSPWD